MNNKNFYVMLVNPPWAGPNTFVDDEIPFSIDDGVLLDDTAFEFDVKLLVDKLASDPSGFPPCDIHKIPGGGYLFSQRLVELLQRLGIDNIQYFNANVTYQSNPQKLTYKAANILGVVSALDMDASEVVLSRKGSVIAIEKMVLDEIRLQGHKMVRLFESVMHVIVHKTVKEAIETEGFTGFMFVSDDKFNMSML
ncbi:MAG TPA: DUF1629 domain-containing protein [Cellvibrio sp.]|nr:DUF1629 domain-containing protein [Cellvibrio sp.]